MFDQLRDRVRIVQRCREANGDFLLQFGDRNSPLVNRQPGIRSMEQRVNRPLADRVRLLKALQYFDNVVTQLIDRITTFHHKQRWQIQPTDHSTNAAQIPGGQ